MKYIKNLFSGIVIGIANIIPGVSGGTMAVILGIYDRIIDAISLNLKKLKKNFTFILTVGLGMLLGISVIAKLLNFLFENYNVATQFFFIGLILGSIPLVWKKTTEFKKFRAINIIPFVITLALMIALAFSKEITNDIITTVDLKEFIVLLFSGTVAAIAMIIPGISGAFMLKAMGQYETVSSAIEIGNFNFAIIIPVAIGIIIGLLVGAKLISVLLNKFQQGVYSAILGLVIGSVVEIYPREFAFNTQGIVAIIVMIIGFMIPVYMNWLDNKHIAVKKNQPLND